MKNKNPRKKQNQASSMEIGDLFRRTREARGMDPKFAENIKREKAEFFEILTESGINTFRLGFNIVAKTPIAMFMNALKMVYEKKYTASKYLDDVFKLFLGQGGIAHDALKVTANAIHLTGQGANIGFRNLLKL